MPDIAGAGGWERMQMGAYRFRCHVVWVFALLYVAAALLGPRLGRSEFYPFFDWSLFSYTNSVRILPVVLVHGVNGKRFEQPVLYHDLPKEFVNYPVGSEVRLIKLLYDLRTAWSRGDQERVDALIQNIRDNYFLRTRSAEFEVAVIRYNPIERYRTGAFVVTRSMARGTK